ncbi:hypothetical protein L4C34_10335 [Vibrio profundum]|uniref:hypothetical protein n=1 Tax=Vibrio profundum TaxID=2910247 RepID=UPI003D152BF8
MHFEGHTLYIKLQGMWNVEGWRDYQDHVQSEVLKSNLPFWGTCVDATEWEFFTSEVWETAQQDGLWAIEHNMRFNGMAMNRIMFKQLTTEHMDNNYPGFDYAIFQNYDECLRWCKEKEATYCRANLDGL